MYKNKFELFLHLPYLKTNLCLFLILFLTLSSETHAQFNQEIFKKGFMLNPYVHNSILALGDQNKDGYDDFLIFDCSAQKSFIFFGGNPVDTVPKFIIDRPNPPIAIVDLNNDGKKDLVFYDFSYDTIDIKKVKIYYGGANINSTPDLMFNPPPGVSRNFGGGTVLKNFSGDGKSELVLMDSNLPYSEKQYGSFYFYDIGNTIDTIPHHTIFGDSINYVRYGNITSSGDINGDGMADFTIGGLDKAVYFRNFYLGNTQWNLTPPVSYYQNQHKFDVGHMSIIKDLNKDGKDDIIIVDYGFYPYYYNNAVLKGNFPIDTIPAWGLNTQNQSIDVDVTSLGDVNGDGFNDFIGTTPHAFTNNLKLWVGGRRIHEVADKTWYGTDPAGFGRIYGAVGDVNGDGLDDIAIGEIYSGGLSCDQGFIHIFNGDSSVKADTVTAINDKNISPPLGYKLDDPYPNPFNPSLTISWQIANRARVKINLFDILGRNIAQILDEEKEPGNNKIELDASKYKLTSGVYLLQFEVYDKGQILYKESKKINYLK